jgi:hypothetical protein
VRRTARLVNKAVLDAAPLLIKQFAQISKTFALD